MRRCLNGVTASAGVAEAGRAPRLDLDEDQRLAVARHDVDFSHARAVATRENCVPAALELAAGVVLA